MLTLLFGLLFYLFILWLGLRAVKGSWLVYRAGAISFRGKVIEGVLPNAIAVALFIWGILFVWLGSTMVYEEISSLS